MRMQQAITVRADLAMPILALKVQVGTDIQYNVQCYIDCEHRVRVVVLTDCLYNRIFTQKRDRGHIGICCHLSIRAKGIIPIRKAT